MHRRNALAYIALAALWPGFLRADTVKAYRDRSLRGPDGKATSLAERARGWRLVVITMKGHWCPVCLRQLVRLAAAMERLTRLRTRVVGLNSDSPKANAAAAKKMGIPMPILSDPEHRVLEALGLWRREAQGPMPGLVVFDECGAERARVVGRRPGERVEGRLFSVLQRIAAAPPDCRGHGNA